MLHAGLFLVFTGISLLSLFVIKALITKDGWQIESDARGFGKSLKFHAVAMPAGALFFWWLTWLMATPSVLATEMTYLTLVAAFAVTGAAACNWHLDLTMDCRTIDKRLVLPLAPAFMLVVAFFFMLSLELPFFSGKPSAERLERFGTIDKTVGIPADFRHIKLMTASSAISKMKTAIGPGSLGSQFAICEESLTLKKVGDEYFWVAALDFNVGMIAWLKNGLLKNQLAVPAYLSVSAERPRSGATLVSTYAGTKMAMKFTPKARGANRLSRIVRAKAPTLVQAAPQFTVDDAGKPFYVVALGNYVMGTTALMPEKTAIIDPQTGSVELFAFGKTPGWIKVALPEKLVVSMTNDSQQYKGRSWFTGYTDGWRNGEKIAADDMWLVEHGGELGYYGTLTSLSATDNAATGAIFVNAVTGRALKFEGLTGVDSSGVVSLINGSLEKNDKWSAKDPIVYRINDKYVWVAPLVDGDATFHGVGVALADMRKLATWGYTLEQALARLETMNVSVGGHSASGSGPKLRIVGIIDRLGDVIESGNKTFRFTLRGGKNAFQADGVDDATSDISLARPGDTVAVEWTNSTGKYLPATSVSITK